MTEGRSISKSLAPLLESLELDQPRVLTTQDLAARAVQVGLDWRPRDIARRLLESGWLLPLKTRGAWEFAPGARAGALGAGDPFIELRATLARSSDAPFSVAAESAAFLLGLSSRQPEPEVISAPTEARIPTALGEFRVVRWTPRSSLMSKKGLPCWSVETLIAFMTSKPGRYRDWPNVGEWIGTAFRNLDLTTLRSELDGEARSSWMRAAYLAQRAGDARAAQLLLDAAPPGKGPYYLIAREEPGVYYSRFDIVDSSREWMAEE